MIYQLIMLLQLLFFVKLSCDFVLSIENLNLKNGNFKRYFEAVNDFSKKIMNIKVVELIKIYNFYFGHLIIHQSDNNIVHNM
jgi:hypothetical protein